jgi:hypothetical protein
MNLSRRQFLRGGAAVSAAAGLPGVWSLAQADVSTPVLLSARSDVEGRHFCSGYALDGRAVFSTPVPVRCHDAVPHPHLPLVVFVARRPGTQVYVLDRENGNIQHVLQARPQRHFYGHGLFDAQGEYLYLVENDTSAPGRGVMGVYQLKAGVLAFVREMPTHGIEPHQFAWLPDHSGFAIANGGVRTEAGSRAALSDVVESSLVVMDVAGRLLSKDTLDDARVSIRHVAVTREGDLYTGQQYIFAEGATLEDGYLPAQGGSLIAMKKPGHHLQLFPLAQAQMDGMQYYSASITVHDELGWLAATAPRGNRFQIWDRQTAACLLDAHAADCAGIALLPDGLLLTSGQGGCQAVRRKAEAQAVVMERLALPRGGWDNHACIG